jgi:hypothetical protein
LNSWSRKEVRHLPRSRSPSGRWTSKASESVKRCKDSKSNTKPISQIRIFLLKDLKRKHSRSYKESFKRGQVIT